MAENNNEIVNIGVNAVVNIDTTLLNKTIDGLSDRITTSFSTSALKSVDGFVKGLKKKLQFSFNDTILGTLKEPIKITLDTKDAGKQIDVLQGKLNELAKVITKIDNAAGPGGTKGASSRKKLSERILTPEETRDKISEQKPIVNTITDLIKSQTAISKKSSNTALNEVREKQLSKLKEAELKIANIVKSNPGAIITEANLEKIKKINNQVKQQFDTAILNEKKFQADTKKLLTEAGNLTKKTSLDKLLDSIDKSKDRLKTQGLTDKQITSATKTVSNQVANLFKDADLLADALKKKTPDLKLVESLVNKINKGTFATQSRVGVIGTSKDIGIKPATSANANIAAADAAEIARLKGIFNPNTLKQSENALSKLDVELGKVRKSVTDMKVPITFVNKQTSSFDGTLTNLRRDLKNVEKEFADGNITLADAAKKYERLTADIRRLKTGIETIDTKRIKTQFDLHEQDPGSLGIRFAGLGFTIGRVAGSLSNFARTFTQVFSQLAQAAEPIERVNNSLDLLVKNGLITADQKISTLRELRDIGDLPGASVESANKTFEQLKRINLTLSERLELTKGLSKLPALTGGDPADSNQLANALTKASSKGKFEGENFQTLLAQGGEPVQKLLQRLGLGTAEDINQFGVGKFIRELSKDLSDLEIPALSTTDRINKLQSRLSELGILLGKILGPGLELLNSFLRDSLVPTLDLLIQKFDSLSPFTKKIIGGIAVAIPIIAAATGGFLALTTAIGFSVSSIIQLGKLLPILKALPIASTLGFGTKTAAGGLATAAVTRTATSLPFAGIAAGGAAAGAVAGATGGAATVGVLTRVSLLLGNIIKSLPKLLGLTNPIGIAINLLLSGVLAFFQNFNGVKDRLLASLSKLDKPINKLLKAFGLEEGGLASLLGYIGKYILVNFEVLGVVISTVGGIIVEVISTIVDEFADLVDGIGNIFLAIKSGDVVGAFESLGKLLYDITLGFLINLGINLVSILIDSIASAVEAALGEGVISGILRSTANSLRGLNGTDAESTAIANRERNQKDSDKRIQDERLKQQEELNQLAINAEKDRIDRLKSANIEVVNLLKKSREEFVKFQLDEKINNLKVNKEELSQKTQDIKDFGKRGLELASTTGDTVLIASLIEERLQQTKKEKIDIENNLSNLDIVGVINKLLSREGVLKPFFEAVDAGSQELKPLIEILEKVRNSPSVPEALKILSQTVPVAERIEQNSILTPGVDSITKQRLNLSGITDRFKNIVSEAGIEVAKKNIEIQKIENQAKKDRQELTKEVNKTNEEIRIKEQERETARKKYLEDQKRLIEDITTEIEKEGRAESSVLNEVNQINDAIKEGKKDRSRQNQDLLDNLDKEIAEINAFREAKRKEITDDTFISDEDQAILLRVLDNTSNKQLNNLKKEKEERVKGFKELEEAYDRLNNKKGNSLLVKFYKDIYDQLRNIANLSVENLAKFGNTLAKLSNAFKSSGGTNGVRDIDILKGELDRLVKKEGLSELSSGYIELRDIITSAESKTFDIATATEKFINILAKLKAQPEIDAFNQQLKDTNIAIANADATAQKGRFIGPDQQDNSVSASKLLPGAPTTRAGVANIIGGFIGPDKSPKEVLDKVKEFLKNNETLNVDLRDELKKTIDSSDASELNAGFFDSVLQIFIRVANGSEESFKEFLKQAFGFNFNQALAIKESIKLYQAKLSRDAAINKAKIEETLRQVEKKQTDDLAIIDQKTTTANKSLSDLDNDARFASGKELKRIRETQNRIKIQLIDFNFQRLDIEEAYNIQKAIIQANGNLAEIAEIKKAGEARRKALLDERNKDIALQVQSGGGRVDKNGNPIDENGNRIQLGVPSILTNTGDSVSEGLTNDTAPQGDFAPILSKSETIIANVKSITDALDGVGNKAREAGNAVLEMYNRLASGEGVLNIFRDAIGGAKFDLQSLGETFKEVAVFGVTAFGDALGKAIADVLVNGGNFLKALGKFFGDTLIMLGTQLLQIGIAAAVLATLGTFFPVLRPLTGGPEGFYAAGVASAIGIGMILLGKALGGGGGSTAAANTSNTGASNAAGASNGTSGQVDYDPEKDPKLVYQKALRTEVYIDIKRDDGSIVKSVVRQVNRNPAFANLIGNQRTGFVL